MRAFVVIGLLMLMTASACMQFDVIECSDGTVCPPATTCDLVHHDCIAPAQLTACEGVPVGAACKDMAGFCRSRVVEPGNVCLSERCGNREVDPREDCDDGDPARCTPDCTLPATIAWTTEGSGPLIANPRHITYDTRAGRVLYVAGGMVWTWAGTAWLQLDDGAPMREGNAPFSFSVAWDTARERLVVLAFRGDLVSSSMEGVVAEWDGGTWTTRPLPAPLFFASHASVYDSVRRELAVLGTTGAGQMAFYTLRLDMPDVIATQRPLPTPLVANVSQFAMTWDAAAQRVMVVRYAASPSDDPDVFEWDGATWQESLGAGLPLGLQEFSLAYDPVVGHVLLVGGQTSPSPTPPPQGGLGVYSWLGFGTGVRWTNLTAQALPVAMSEPAVVFDVARSRRVMFVGSLPGSGGNDIYEWTGSTYQKPVWTQPRYLSSCIADPTHGLFIVDDAGDLWRRTGAFAWMRVGATTDPTRAITYDPSRNTLVQVRAAGTQALDASGTWTSVGPGLDATSVTFDPSRQRLVAIAPIAGASGADQASGLYELDGTWKVLSVGPPAISGSSLAFDARKNDLFAHSSFALFDIDSQWHATVGPNGEAPASAALRGSVLTTGSDLTTTTLWERINGRWSNRGTVPHSAIGGLCYDSKTGEVIFVGTLGEEAYGMVRGTFAGVSTESCVAGEDVDGDLRAGCDDPDCWFTCSPTCPLYASCTVQ